MCTSTRFNTRAYCYDSSQSKRKYVQYTTYTYTCAYNNVYFIILATYLRRYGLRKYFRNKVRRYPRRLVLKVLILLRRQLTFEGTFVLSKVLSSCVQYCTVRVQLYTARTFVRKFSISISRNHVIVYMKA